MLAATQHDHWRISRHNIWVAVIVIRRIRVTAVHWVRVVIPARQIEVHVVTHARQQIAKRIQAASIRLGSVCHRPCVARWRIQRYSYTRYWWLRLVLQPIVVQVFPHIVTQAGHLPYAGIHIWVDRVGSHHHIRSASAAVYITTRHRVVVLLRELIPRIPAR